MLTLRGVEFFEPKIRISSRKRIVQQNHFSLFSGTQLVGFIYLKNSKIFFYTASFNVIIYKKNPYVLFLAERMRSVDRS